MDLKSALTTLVDNGEEIYCVNGTVQSVDENKRTCVIELLNEGGQIEDVNLQAVEGSAMGILVVPVVGSIVSVGWYDKASALVVKYSDIKQVKIKIESLQIEVDKKGVSVQNHGEDFKDMILELIGYIKRIIVVQGTGPDVGGLTTLEGRFKKILK